MCHFVRAVPSGLTSVFRLEQPVADRGQAIGRIDRLVPRAGFEPATSRFVGGCSFQLSYRGVGTRSPSPNPLH